MNNKIEKLTSIPNGEKLYLIDKLKDKKAIVIESKKKFSPVIILFEPQLEENIGAVARAMLNFNFHNIRIIKKGWKPSKIAFKNSAKADEILKNAKVYCEF